MYQGAIYYNNLIKTLWRCQLSLPSRLITLWCLNCINKLCSRVSAWEMKGCDGNTRSIHVTHNRKLCIVVVLIVFRWMLSLSWPQLWFHLSKHNPPSSHTATPTFIHRCHPWSPLTAWWLMCKRAYNLTIALKTASRAARQQYSTANWSEPFFLFWWINFSLHHMKWWMAY